MVLILTLTENFRPDECLLCDGSAMMDPEKMAKHLAKEHELSSESVASFKSGSRAGVVKETSETVNQKMEVEEQDSDSEDTDPEVHVEEQDFDSHVSDSDEQGRSSQLGL